MNLFSMSIDTEEELHGPGEHKDELILPRIKEEKLKPIAYTALNLFQET